MARILPANKLYGQLIEVIKKRFDVEHVDLVNVELTNSPFGFVEDEAFFVVHFECEMCKASIVLDGNLSILSN